jgi:putative ABC transport system permease protein
MNLVQSIITAVQAILRNKLRSALTMLGIVIGVGAVIALVAAGAGAQQQVLARFESLGANILTISPGASMFRGPRSSTTDKTFTMANVETIRTLASSVVALAPQYSGNATVGYGSNNTNTQVLGVTPEYQSVNEIKVESGRFLNSLDVSNRERVVVLSSTMAETLFSGTLVNPLGQMIKINRERYEVVGVLAATTSSVPFMSSQNVIIPLTTAQLKFGGVGNTTVSSIGVKVTSSSDVAFAKAQLRTIVRSIRGLTGTASDDFNIADPSQIVSNITATSQTFTTLLSSIAAISLLVGGIGVMNIMLVSVTERTREIGIRKAIGAKRQHILLQFLVESTVLGLVGGLLGVAIGIGAAQIIAPLLGASQAVVTVQSVVLAMGVSMAVGIFFGIYPANRASMLNPIEALRYE